MLKVYIESILHAFLCAVLAYQAFADFNKAGLVFLVMFNILFVLEKINESIRNK